MTYLYFIDKMPKKIPAARLWTQYAFDGNWKIDVCTGMILISSQRWDTLPRAEVWEMVHKKYTSLKDDEPRERYIWKDGWNDNR